MIKKDLTCVVLLLIFFANAAFCVYQSILLRAIFLQRDEIKRHSTYNHVFSITMLKDKVNNKKLPNSLLASSPVTNAGSEVIPPVSSQEAKLRLLGVCHGAMPLAFIELTDLRKTGIYTEGSVLGRFSIISILSDRVILEIDEKKRALIIENDPSPFTVVRCIKENERIIEKDAVSDMVISAVKEMNYIKIFEAIEDGSGEGSGMRLKNLQNSGTIEALGFRNNDLIKSVNKMPIKDISDAFEIAKKIQKVKIVEIEVIRDNAIQTLKYYLSE